MPAQKCLVSYLFPQKKHHTLSAMKIQLINFILRNMWATENILINIYHMLCVRPGSVNIKNMIQLNSGILQSSQKAKKRADFALS